MATSNPGKTSPSNGDTKAKQAGAFQISKEPVAESPIEDPSIHKYEPAREHAPDAPPSEPAFENLGELPQSYGSNTLYLVARDPHWLFSYWDIEAAETNGISPDGKFFLKLFQAGGAEEFTTEVNLDARNWYLPVKQAGQTYYAELGYYGAGGGWVSIARSPDATAPQDRFSESADAAFATVPIHLTFQRLLEMVRGNMLEGESLIAALSRLQSEGRKLLFQPGRTPEWTEEQRHLLTALFGNEVVSRISMGSGEIDQLLRRELLEKLSTESASELVAKSLIGLEESSLFSAFAGFLGSSEVTSWSSALGSSWSAQPFGQQREFFMHVNAEVIFYGGTHPDAKVWIDGKQIQLGPDGSFRYHFRFPDGNYDIPIVAESPDGVEQRSAALRFERATARRGEVGATAQPEHLGVPMGQR